jgi:Gpi18-like mannosyltransferase
MNISGRFHGRSLFFCLIILGIFVRIVFLPVVSEDLIDYLLPWYDHILSQGLKDSIGGNFSNYTPPYLYLLGIATLTKGFLSATIAIKLISILFDLCNAFLVMRIVSIRTKNENASFIAGGLFFLLPTVVLNSAAWGQADSIYTCFILASLFFVLKERPIPALIFFGVAFAFKAQAIFFAPFLLLLTLKRRIPWQGFLVVPVTYLVMMVPALLAGRSLSSVLSVYLTQVGTYRVLSMHAPNPYLFISNDWYRPVLLLGSVIAVLVTLVWVIGYNWKIKELNKEILLICAAVSVSLTPFILPKMHERYFYLMDVFTFLLAFYIPRFWLPAVLAQGVSVLTYSIFLFTPARMSIAFRNDLFLLLAVCVNSILIAYLLWKQHNVVQLQSAR